MRAIKSLLVVTAVAGLVTTMGARSFADKLPPTLNLPKVAGESEIRDTTGVSPSGFVGNVDWIVLAPGNYSGTVYVPFILGAGKDPSDLDEYLYLYQVEARTDYIVSFTVFTKGPVSKAGTFLVPLDLDSYDNNPVHDSNNSDFPWLSEEFDVSASLVSPDKFKWPDPHLLQWQWADVDFVTGQESYVMYLLSPLPPTYGLATLKNQGSGSTLTIPVPSPEPSVIVLLMVGTGMMGIAYRRRVA